MEKVTNKTKSKAPTKNNSASVDLKEATAPELTKEQIKIIKERFKRIDSGGTKLMDWDDVRKKFSRFE